MTTKKATLTNYEIKNFILANLINNYFKHVFKGEIKRGLRNSKFIYKKLPNKIT